MRIITYIQGAGFDAGILVGKVSGDEETRIGMALERTIEIKAGTYGATYELTLDLGTEGTGLKKFAAQKAELLLSHIQNAQLLEVLDPNSPDVEEQVKLLAGAQKTLDMSDEKTVQLAMQLAGLKRMLDDAEGDGNMPKDVMRWVVAYKELYEKRIAKIRAGGKECETPMNTAMLEAVVFADLRATLLSYIKSLRATDKEEFVEFEKQRLQNDIRELLENRRSIEQNVPKLFKGDAELDEMTHGSLVKSLLFLTESVVIADIAGMAGERAQLFEEGMRLLSLYEKIYGTEKAAEMKRAAETLANYQTILAGNMAMKLAAGAGKK
ncbi:Uncharacterised protein [Candidatus Gugararchaeum adminiculabundum]|nr:Uncharacterised protein [Candidatus Gugararchaeum adminiculabundum]